MTPAAETEHLPMNPFRAAAWPRLVRWALFGLIIALFCLRSLPWNLDEFDQAKQAYASLEMVADGHWLFQHSPHGGLPALKPPLAGWLAAVLYYLTGGCWEAAWRLPSLAAAMVTFSVLASEGRRSFGEEGGLFAAGAFGLNQLAQRMSTLVDTNMLTSAWVFLAGWLIYRHIRSRTPWTARSRWSLALFLLAGLMTKGPVIYAFLAPGLLAEHLFSRDKGAPFHGWSGWASWLLPLIPFAAWVGAVIWLDPPFFHEVVLKEFLGRFSVGEAAVHKSQPLYFYLPHLLHKFAPWSLLVIGIPIFSRSVRRLVLGDPSVRWLVLWAAGGFVFMSLVPSKRVDRIFPIVPPLCLLLAAFAEAPESITSVNGGAVRPAFQRNARRLCWAAFAFAATATAVYGVWVVRDDYRHHADTLMRFGVKVRRYAAATALDFSLVEAENEGLWLYLRKTHALSLEQAVAGWRSGDIKAVVCNATEQSRFVESRVLYASEPARAPRGQYLFLARPDAAAPP